MARINKAFELKGGKGGSVVVLRFAVRDGELHVDDVEGDTIAALDYAGVKELEEALWDLEEALWDLRRELPEPEKAATAETPATEPV